MGSSAAARAQVPDLQVPAAARARRGIVDVRESDAVPWEWLAAVHDGDLLERIRDGAMTVREQRGLGLPWSELAGRARAAVGRRHAGRGSARVAVWRGDEPRRRHPPRGPRLRARLLPVQRRRGDGGAAARRGPGAARARGRLRRPPGRRHRADPRPGPRRVHDLPARRAQLPVRAHPLRSGRRSAVRNRRRRVPARAVGRARRRRPARTSRSSSPAPIRGRATGSAGSR